MWKQEFIWKFWPSTKDRRSNDWDWHDKMIRLTSNEASKVSHKSNIWPLTREETHIYCITCISYHYTTTTSDAHSNSAKTEPNDCIKLHNGKHNLYTYVFETNNTLCPETESNTMPEKEVIHRHNLSVHVATPCSCNSRFPQRCVTYKLHCHYYYV